MDKIVMLGHIIKQARGDKGWTQQELADKMEIDLESIKNMKKVQTLPILGRWRRTSFY